MEEKKQSFTNQLWEMRHLSVEECIQQVQKNPELKFLLTMGGFWYLTRKLLQLFVTVNVIYFVYHVFSIVLS